MRQILSNRDLKTLIQGVAGVAASGLLLGAAMQPNLDEHAVQGPQMQLPGGGARGTGPAGDASAAYPGQPPEYVVGTDWTRPRPVQYAGAGAGSDDTDVVVLAADDDPAPAPRRTAWRDEPRAPTAYPSVRGSVDYEANLPAPPAPPGGDDRDGGEADAG